MNLCPFKIVEPSDQIICILYVQLCSSDKTETDLTRAIEDTKTIVLPSGNWVSISNNLKRNKRHGFEAMDLKEKIKTNHVLLRSRISCQWFPVISPIDRGLTC